MTGWKISWGRLLNTVSILVVRGMSVRKQFRPVIKKRREAAVMIQGVFRGHQVRLKVKEEKAQEEEQAKKLQAGNVPSRALRVVCI